ncbi:fasting-inducible integral membrane protein tm6p1-related [Holotrichia oblita]|uniref:Fasting-inducible integral membrane protein tm6p1-related n=1 Tax=Holotrichia oblita TaxID=644536 RepID=A0ACB9SU52_HOLOL|nr:fasting-inducible integral membrane protein tm6p1-related [Holotrichia oblita]
MLATNIYSLTITHFVLFIVTFLVTYTISVYYGHVYPIWPYISDTGVKVPESCIMSQLFTIGSVLTVGIIYCRYLVIKHTSEIYSLSPLVNRLNNASLWIGFLVALGISLLSNFPRKAHWKIHFLGVAMAFGLGNVYEIIQIILSIYVYPKIGSKLIIGTRIAITSAFNACIICSATCGRISMKQFNGADILQWLPEHAGFTLHIISSITGWTSAILAMMFLLTYTFEFKDIVIYESIFEMSEEVTNDH